MQKAKCVSFNDKNNKKIFIIFIIKLPTNKGDRPVGYQLMNK